MEYPNSLASSGQTILLCFLPTKTQKQIILKGLGIESEPEINLKEAYENQKKLLEEQQKLLNILLEKQRQEDQKKAETPKKAVTAPSPEAVKQIIKLEKKKTALQNRINTLQRFNPKTSVYFICFLLLAFLCILPFGITGFDESLKNIFGVAVIAFAVCALFSPLLVRSAKKQNENQLRILSEQLNQIDTQIQSYKKT